MDTLLALSLFAILFLILLVLRLLSNEIDAYRMPEGWDFHQAKDNEID